MESLSEIQALRTEMREGFAKSDQRFTSIDEHFDQRIEDTKVDLRLEIKKSERRIRRYIRKFHEETRRHFEIIAERMHSTVMLLVEQLRSERSTREAIGQRVEAIEEREITTQNRLVVLERKKR